MSQTGTELSDEHVEGVTWRSLMLVSHANSILGQGCTELYAQGPQGGSMMFVFQCQSQRSHWKLDREGVKAGAGPWGHQAAVHTQESSESTKRSALAGFVCHLNAS